MSEFEYYFLNVFPKTPNGGNELGVVIIPKELQLATDKMQQFAKEKNTVETTFISFPNGDYDYSIRIFTPNKEIPFAGHPIIGSSFIAAMTINKETIVLNALMDGRTSIVQKSGDILFLKNPKAYVGETIDVSNCFPNNIGSKLVNGGRSWIICELASEAKVREYKITNEEYEKIKDHANITKSMGICIFTRVDSEHIVVRAFPAGQNIREDPASGAANALVAEYICDIYGVKHNYVVSQGKEMGFDAELYVKYEDDSVWVGGRTDIVSCDTIIL
jgi:PhzF family phenazine biosynthesis protein